VKKLDARIARKTVAYNGAAAGRRVFAPALAWRFSNAEGESLFGHFGATKWARGMGTGSNRVARGLDEFREGAVWGVGGTRVVFLQ